MEQKRFPANTTLDIETFLNNNKIDGELYAYLQGISDYDVIDKEHNQFMTYILKEKMPTQKELCGILKVISEKTVREHLKKLEEGKFIIRSENKKIAYILPEVENIYFLIPLDTLKYLNSNCKKHVIKTYIYLGQRYKMAQKMGQQYEFTLEEIGEHIGISVKNHAKQYELIKYALELLANSGLIEYISFFNGVANRKKLIKFNLEYKKVETEMKNPNR